jgi:hypothetical protein
VQEYNRVSRGAVFASADSVKGIRLCRVEGATVNNPSKRKNGSGKQKKVRALMAELGTNYTTALRVYEATVANLHAEEDAAAAEKLSGASGQDRRPESAAPAASASALNLQFSGSPDAEANRPE